MLLLITEITEIAWPWIMSQHGLLLGFFSKKKKLLGLYLIRESAVLPLNLVCVVQS